MAEIVPVRSKPEEFKAISMVTKTRDQSVSKLNRRTLDTAIGA